MPCSARLGATRGKPENRQVARSSHSTLRRSVCSGTEPDTRTRRVTAIHLRHRSAQEVHMVGCRVVFFAYTLGVAPVALSATPDDPRHPRALTSRPVTWLHRGTLVRLRSPAAPTTRQPRSRWAGFHYAMTEHPKLNIDVFVYPAGQRAQAEAIEHGMSAFRKDLAAARTQGTCSRLDELDQSRFVLTSDDAPKNIPANTVDAKVIAAIADAEPFVGETLQLSVDLASSGMPRLSNGYLVYTQLHYIKVRVSAAQQAIAQTRFDALADQAARARTGHPSQQCWRVRGPERPPRCQGHARSRRR